MVIVLHHLGVLFFQPDLLFQIVFPLPQLGGHGVEGLGEFAQIAHILAVVALRHLLCLPRQMVEIGVDVLQVLAKRVVPGGRKGRKIPPREGGGAAFQLLHGFFEELQSPPQLPVRLVQRLQLKLRHPGIVEDAPQIFK